MTRALHRPEYRKLLKLLIKARRERGITQADMAVKLGKTQSFISKVERGERRLDVIEFMDFSKAIGVSPFDLLTEVER